MGSFGTAVRSFARATAAAALVAAAPALGGGRILETTVGGSPYQLAADGDGVVYCTNGTGLSTLKNGVSGEDLIGPYPETHLAGIAYLSGVLYMTDPAANKIWTKSLVSGAINSYPIPTGLADAYYIAAGPDGNVWFTEYGGNKVAKLSGGTITEYALPHAGSAPTGIAAALDGPYMYFAEHAGRIGRINVNTGAIAEIATPSGASLTAVAASMHHVAYVTDGSGKVGIWPIGPTSVLPTEYPLPDSSVDGSAIVWDRDSRFWFTDYTGDRLGSFDEAGNVTMTPLASGVDPAGLVLGPRGDLFFSESSTGKLAQYRLRVPGDVNGDGAVAVSDVFYLINFLFAGGAAPK